MSKLDEKILQTKKLLDDLKRERQELAKRDRAARPRKKPGRKPLSPETLRRAEKLADKLPLPEVALRCSVALRSLYNNGISRAALNKKKAAQGNFDPCRL